ncbi:MAG: hypothetical protein IMF18_03160 [Proteobacteria bacterium]|nr:hypothetical protein [Pseudomonadota bacterium]
MSRVVDFVVIFDDGVRKRHFHETDKGRVVRFVVQLEVKIESQWKPVIRYDCAHGFSHADRYDISGNKTKARLDLKFENALTFADWDINRNWEKYKTKFLGDG